MKIQILRTDDWVGVYVRGRLVYEGHSIEPIHLLELAEINHDYQYVESDEFEERFGTQCPQVWPDPERGM